LNFTPGQTISGLGTGNTSIYYYTGSSTSAISQSLVSLTSITLNQTALDNGFTTSGSSVYFSSSSLGSKTGTATLAGTYSGVGNTNPSSASFSITISLQEICGGSIVTSQTYTNTPSASGTTFTDNINLATASSLFQYAFSRGAIPTYSVTGIALNQTAIDNGFTKPGNNSIGFSKTGAGTVGGIATITGTYDKQDGAGNTTSFSLALTLSEVCIISAKTMNTDTETFSKTASSGKTTFDIFNSTYFRYTDGIVVANLSIADVQFNPISSGGMWMWSGSGGTYSGESLASFGSIELTYAPFTGHLVEGNLVSNESSEIIVEDFKLVEHKLSSSSSASGSGSGTSAINTFTATANITGSYDDFLGNFVSFSKSINLIANF
jgi:hypothetical protein